MAAAPLQSSSDATQQPQRTAHRPVREGLSTTTYYFNDTTAPVIDSSSNLSDRRLQVTLAELNAMREKIDHLQLQNEVLQAALEDVLGKPGSVDEPAAHDEIERLRRQVEVLQTALERALGTVRLEGPVRMALQTTQAMCAELAAGALAADEAARLELESALEHLQIENDALRHVVDDLLRDSRVADELLAEYRQQHAAPGDADASALRDEVDHLQYCNNKNDT
jgi:hypothetical protein